MLHPNAPLAPEGRRRLCERVDAGRPISHVAAEAGVARQTLGKWHERWTVEGEQGLLDRSSRPASSPNQTPVEVEDRVEAPRREHKLGPVQLMGLLQAEGIELASSTIYRVLVRRGISRLRDLDVSGGDLREPVHRYEWARPGDMVPSTSRSSGASPRVAAGACTDAHRPSIVPRAEPRPGALVPATSTCTQRWTITHAWPTPRNCPTSEGPRRRRSGPGR